MRLIAKKPCDFGGRRFYIGEEIPEDLVADPKRLEAFGVITIANSENEVVPDGEPGTSFLPKAGETEESPGRVMIDLNTGEGEHTCIPASLKQLQCVFELLQTTEGRAVKSIAGISDVNVLTIVSYADPRKKVREVAKEREKEILTFSDGEAATNDGESEGNEAGDE